MVKQKLPPTITLNCASKSCCLWMLFLGVQKKRDVIIWDRKLMSLVCATNWKKKKDVEQFFSSSSSNNKMRLEYDNLEVVENVMKPLKAEIIP